MSKGHPMSFRDVMKHVVPIPKHGHEFDDNGNIIERKDPVENTAPARKNEFKKSKKKVIEKNNPTQK